MTNRGLHPEEARAIEGLRKKFGDDVVKVMNVDQLDNTTADEAAILFMTMDAGNVGQAAEMAHAANDLVNRNPAIKFLFGINGCEDDKREIDQIPEARLTLRKLYEGLSREAFWRFDIEHQALMLVAMNVGQRQGTTLNVPPWMVKAP